jgi:predicted RNA-binding Zn-ribbon protein involved in translation (DUF1610 family)
MKCSHDPKQYKGMPMGMYHCPECGEMVIAGCEHPDYEGAFKDVSIHDPKPGEKNRICSECGRHLDWRGKCHECLNDQFLNEEYDAYSESQAGEP